MKSENLSDWTEQELIEEEKKEKASQTTYAFIIGMLIGIAVYSVVKNGFGFLTIILLIFVRNFIVKSKHYKDVQKEIESRKTQ